MLFLCSYGRYRFGRFLVSRLQLHQLLVFLPCPAQQCLFSLDLLPHCGQFLFLGRDDLLSDPAVDRLNVEVLLCSLDLSQCDEDVDAIVDPASDGLLLFLFEPALLRFLFDTAVKVR